MMGKKKVAQTMKPEESGSFLAGQVQPTAPSKAEGIQEKKEEVKKEEEPKKVEPPKLKTLLEKIDDMTLEELEKEINRILGEYKEFSDLMNKIKKHLDFTYNAGKDFGMPYYYIDKITDGYQAILNHSKYVYETYLNKLSLAYSKKKFNIQI